MRFLIAPFVLVAALTAACGGGGDRADTVPTRTPAPSVATSATVTVASPTAEPPANIAELLFTLDDMPPGWSPVQADGSDEDTNEGLCALEGSPYKGMATATVEVTFQQSALGPFYSQTINQADGDLAEKQLAWMREQAGGCGSWTETDPASGVSTTYYVDALSFDRYGDETFAMRLRSDATIYGALQVDFVLVRYGGVLVTHSFATFALAAGDASTFVTLVEKSDERARQLLP